MPVVIPPDFSKPREGVYVIEIFPQKISFNGQRRRLPPSLNDRVHWAMRHLWAAAFSKATFYTVKEAQIPQLRKANITIEQLSTQGRILDFDNLASAVKPVIDGIVLAGVIPDDDPDHLSNLLLTCTKVLHLVDEKILVHIEPVL